MPFPSPREFPNLGIKTTSFASPALVGGFFATVPPGKPSFKPSLPVYCFFSVSFCVFALVLSKVFYSNKTILKYFGSFLCYYFYYTSSPKQIHYSHQFSRIEINVMYISLDGIVYLSERSQSTVDCSRMNYWENPWLLIYGPQDARLLVLMREE